MSKMSSAAPKREQNLPGRARGWRRPATWLALFALFLNAALPLVSMADTARAAGPGAYLSGDSVETIVICTGTGMRVVHLGPDGEPLSGNTQGDGFCPLCTISVAIDPARSTQVEPASDDGPDRGALAPAHADLPRPSIHATPSAPRAPPLDI